MYRDIVEWRGQNAPPATMMIIPDKVRGVFDWDLLRQQQRTRYNLFLAYSVKPRVANLLCTSEEWCWASLLYSKQSGPVVVQSAKLYCKSCNFDCQSLKKFEKHLSSYKHVREVSIVSLFASIWLRFCVKHEHFNNLFIYFGNYVYVYIYI